MTCSPRQEDCGRGRGTAQRIPIAHEPGGSGWAQRLGDELRPRLSGHDPRTMTILGAALIFVGLVYLLGSPGFAWARRLHFQFLWPLLLIGGGLALMPRRMRGG
jgi:hypothetical protein